ncbi:PAS domain S-box-containing protein [Salegentibacter holothuriorum]|uniref:PAS domain S-box-containing protein n=1 Tax=Salegentibacter holothuriorum TaxID=241145 RepID=A0A1T5BQ87_9FLAO|nr:PAS domain-containing protein [Salegentibacter holothuriorum]SKB49110.1 PAS domain S-box-containing protein [Salegentibacter holothuriorum]
MKKNLMNMQSLDIYLSSLSMEEYREIENDIRISEIKLMPLRSWDIYNDYYAKQLAVIRQQHTIGIFKELAKKFEWQNDLDAVFKDKAFDALVLTNKEAKIEWVSEGFSEMTGYSSSFAVNKTPHFLQGEETDQAALERIRHKLSRDEPFTEVLVNYRKDRTTYNCEISVIPLINENTTHYLALERQAV